MFIIISDDGYFRCEYSGTLSGAVDYAAQHIDGDYQILDWDDDWEPTLVSRTDGVVEYADGVDEPAALIRAEHAAEMRALRADERA